jgi:hypothetical protein
MIFRQPQDALCYRPAGSVPMSNSSRGLIGSPPGPMFRPRRLVCLTLSQQPVSSSRKMEPTESHRQLQPHGQRMEMACA